MLYFLPVAALWLAWRRKGGARRAAWLLAAATLVVAPWTVRNWLVFDAFVPVSTSGALNLWQGNTRLSRQQVYEEYWAVHGRIPKYELARRRAVEAILERQPLWILEKLRDEMPAFWAAHGQPVVHLERGAYGAVARPRALAAVVLVLVPYLLALALFVTGSRAAAARPRAAPRPLLPRPSTSCSTWPRTAYPRYRLPAMPAVFLVAAHGWVALRARPRAAVERRLGLAAVVTALVLALSVGPSLVTWATRPWPPPWFAGAGVEGEAEGAPPGETPQEGH